MDIWRFIKLFYYKISLDPIPSPCIVSFLYYFCSAKSLKQWSVVTVSGPSPSILFETISKHSLPLPLKLLASRSSITSIMLIQWSIFNAHLLILSYQQHLTQLFPFLIPDTLLLVSRTPLSLAFPPTFTRCSFSLSFAWSSSSS